MACVSTSHPPPAVACHTLQTAARVPHSSPVDVRSCLQACIAALTRKLAHEAGFRARAVTLSWPYGGEDVVARAQLAPSGVATATGQQPVHEVPAADGESQSEVEQVALVRQPCGAWSADVSVRSCRAIACHLRLLLPCTPALPRLVCTAVQQNVRGKAALRFAEAGMASAKWCRERPAMKGQGPVLEWPALKAPATKVPAVQARNEGPQSRPGHSMQTGQAAA